MLFRFGAFSLDPVRYELRGPAGPVHVEPQVFDVLRYLVERRDRVVTKQELLEAVWGSRFVSESTLTSRIKAARRAIDDDGERQASIRTVRGRGFRFAATVTEETTDDSEPDEGRVGDGRWRLRLPMTLGDLVGRESEVSALLSLVQAARQVSVIGPGGVGKTRCAIEAAAAFGKGQEVSVDFVDLTTTRDPGEVTRLIAEAVGVPVESAQGALPALCEAMRSEQRLLVLDNAEHVLAAASDIAALLAAASSLRVVVTSRERLRLQGERVLVLEPLGAAAVELFETCAQRLDPSFIVDDANRDDVWSLCQEVDGLPLGIELVAAHIRLLPPAALRQRLGGQLSSLRGDTRNAPARQLTMDDTIDWSIGLLDPAERTLLTRMSTFETGADLDAVSFVALPGLELDVVPAAAALTDKSLLHRRIGTDGSPRFFMLSLVRAQTARLLAETDEEQEVRSRHATFHHRLVVELEQRRWTELADSWTGLVSERFADVEAALDYGFSRGDGAEAAATVAHLYGFWHRDRRLAAGARWTEAAFHHVDQLSILDQGLLHEGAGYLAFWRHETAQARSYWEQATDLFGQAGADRYRALATVDAAGTWMGQMDYADAAISHCQEGVELSRAVGEAPLVAHALNVLGELARLAGRDSQAKVAYEEGLDIVREIGDEQHQTIFELNLSVLALGRGNLEAAQSFARVALGRALQLRRQVMAANALVTVSGVHTALGELETGAYLLGAAEAALASLKASLGPGDHPDYLRFRNTLEEELGTDRLAELVAEGGQVSLAAAAARVLDQAR